MLPLLLAAEEKEQKTFSNPNLIMMPSTENVGKGKLDFSFNHRFGNAAESQFGGLDKGASMKLSLDYGLTEKWTIGFGRASYGNTYELNSKYRIFQYGRKIPLTLSLFAAAGQETGNQTIQMQPGVHVANSGIAAVDTEINKQFNSYTLSTADKQSYMAAILLSARFNDYISFQAAPMYVHRNFVKNKLGNDRTGLSLGGKIKLSRTTSLLAEGILTPKRDYQGDSYDQEDRKSYENQNTLSAQEINSSYNTPSDAAYVYLRNVYFDKPVQYRSIPVALGIDIATAGHNFQLFITNSRDISHTWLLRGAEYDYFKREWTLGFNIRRTFSVARNSKEIGNYEKSIESGKNDPCSTSGQSFAQLQSVVQPTCTNCHSGTEPVAGFNITDYQSVVKRSSNTPGKSLIFQKITTGSMSDRATPEIKKALFCWIKNGRRK